MGDWPEYPLGSFVDPQRSICYGIVQPGKPRERGVPIIRVNNFKDGHIDTRDALTIDPEIEGRYQRSRLQGGELLLTLVGTMGLSAIVPNELRGWNVARAVGVVPLKENVDKRWLNFMLRSQPSQDFVQTHANTTVQATFNLRDLARLPIPMPPDNVRLPASGLLSALDDKIELNRRMNETLEAMARAIFKDWFVDFGPTRAKAEDRAPYLAPEIWDLFPDALDDEDTPVGWSFDTLARLAVTNSESWTARHHPPTVEYVNLSNTKWGNIEATTLLDWEAAPSRARRIAKAGDTIMGTTRPGNGSFAYISRDGLTVSTGFAVLSPRSAMYRDTVYIAATSVENIGRLANLADGHGGAYPAVKPNEVTDTVIVFPGDEVLASFADLVSPIREKIEHAKAESRTLAQTGDLLLAKLMSGEIRLAEAEKGLEAVA